MQLVAKPPVTSANIMESELVAMRPAAVNLADAVADEGAAAVGPLASIQLKTTELLEPVQGTC